MRQTPVVSRSMAGSPLAGAAPHRMLSAAEVGGPLTGCSGPPGFVSCLAMMRKTRDTRACMLGSGTDAADASQYVCDNAVHDILFLRSWSFGKL